MSNEEKGDIVPKKIEEGKGIRWISSCMMNNYEQVIL